MDLLLHPVTKHQLLSVAGHPAGSYILYGEIGLGKYTAASHLAKILNCATGNATDGCANCRLIEAGNFPDVLDVEPLEGKSSIGIEQIQQLQQDLKLSRYNPKGYRVVIIDQAELLTPEAQNCLLKTMEEPPAKTLICLVSRNLDSLLPTVQSRSKVIGFSVLPSKAVTEQLIKLGENESRARQLASFSNGRIGYALQLAQDQEAYTSYERLDELVETIFSANILERFRIAAGVAGQKEDLKTMLNLIAARLRGSLRIAASKMDQAQISATGRRLQALERVHRYIAANVNPKLALESMMLEL